MHGQYLFNYRAGERVVVHGRVVGHEVQESGWLIFKKRQPVVRVRVNTEDRKRILHQYTRITCARDHTPIRIPAVISLLASEEEQRNCPIGAEVEAVFGYAPPIYQHGYRTEALGFLELQPAAA